MDAPKKKPGPTRLPWMQVDLDLPTKPETQRICDLADCETALAVGRLVMFWGWVDRHADGPLLAGLTHKSLARLIGGNSEFWQAVEAVGWLSSTPEGLVIPGYEERFSESARKRLLDARRQERSRLGQPASHETDHDPVTPERDNSVTPGVTESLPRRRRRVREEINTLASTSTSDVAAEKHNYDWEEARRDANKAIAKLGVRPQKPADRELLIKAAALKQQPLSENWFFGAIDSTTERYSQDRPPAIGQYGYLHGAWKARSRELHNRDFNFLLTKVDVPDEVLNPPKPPPRESG